MKLVFTENKKEIATYFSTKGKGKMIYESGPSLTYNFIEETTCPETACTNPPYVTFGGDDRTVELTGATGTVRLMSLCLCSSCPIVLNLIILYLKQDPTMAMYDGGEYTVDNAFGQCPDKICTTFTTLASKCIFHSICNMLITLHPTETTSETPRSCSFAGRP